MMHRMGMLVAVLAVAACGAGKSGDADAPGAPPSAASVDSAAGSAQAETRSVAGDTFAFALHETQPGVVDSITVTRGGGAVQTLVPTENHVLPETGIQRISRIDLDDDGHADLGLVTEMAMVNSRSDYWRLDPRTGRFAFAGTAPTLEPDSAAPGHRAFHRGGHGGRLWTASRWRWMDGALVEVRREEQAWLDGAERYARIVHERRAGALAEVSRDTLEEHELEAGP